jgi:hypothetical protein
MSATGDDGLDGIGTYNKLLDELNVRTRLLRQVVVRLGVRRRLVPALELFVLKGRNVSASLDTHVYAGTKKGASATHHDLKPLQQTEIGKEEFDLLSASRVLVCDGDFDLLEAIENVELRQVERSVVVDGLYCVSGDIRLKVSRLKNQDIPLSTSRQRDLTTVGLTPLAPALLSHNSWKSLTPHLRFLPVLTPHSRP